MPPSGSLNGIHLAAYQSPQAAIQRAEVGRRAHNNTFARLMREKIVWQRVSLGLLTTTVLATGSLVWMTTWGVRSEVFVIKVDQLGYEQVLSPAARAEKPIPSVVHGVSLAWIEQVRAISEDAVVFTKNWEKVADYTTRAGWQQLSAFRREQAQRQQQGRRAQITVTGFMPIGGTTNAYTLTWREEVYDRTGQLIIEESGLWTATLRLADFASQTAKEEVELRRKTRNFRNVMGIFVDEISWIMRPLPPKD